MKMKVGLSLEEITVKRVHLMATATRRDKSTIVDMAIELLAQQDEFQALATSLNPIKPSARARARSRKVKPESIPGVKRGVVA